MEKEKKFKIWNTIEKKFENTLHTPLLYNQYICKKDMAGKEIYEMDVLEHSAVGLGYVDYCPRCLGYQCHFKFEGKDLCHNCEGDFNLAELDNVLIIGNILENPRLVRVM